MENEDIVDWFNSKKDELVEEYAQSLERSHFSKEDEDKFNNKLHELFLEFERKFEKIDKNEKNKIRWVNKIENIKRFIRKTIHKNEN